MELRDGHRGIDHGYVGLRRNRDKTRAADLWRNCASGKVIKFKFDFRDNPRFGAGILKGL